jgi:hypothetical protein
MPAPAAADMLRFCSRIEPARPRAASVIVHPDDLASVTLRAEPGGIALRCGSDPVTQIRRTRGLLLRRFEAPAEAAGGWSLSTRSLLRHRHELHLGDGQAWRLRTPFFSVGIEGCERQGARLRGRIGRSRAEWLVEVDAPAATPGLVSALAFLHWLCYFNA